MCAECTGHLSKSGNSASVKRGDETRKPTNQSQNTNKTQKTNPSKNLQSFDLYIEVRHGETRELLRLATRASNSRIICCSCLWSGFVRSGLVRTGLITAACHRRWQPVPTPVLGLWLQYLLALFPLGHCPVRQCGWAEGEREAMSCFQARDSERTPRPADPSAVGLVVVLGFLFSVL